MSRVRHQTNESNFRQFPAACFAASSMSIPAMLDIFVSPVVRLVTSSKRVSVRHKSRAKLAVDDRSHLALVAEQPVPPRRWPAGGAACRCL